MNNRDAIVFPPFTGLRCLMMPYIQGDAGSVPQEYAAYNNIINVLFLKRGERGFLTIDESIAKAGLPHRGARAKYSRALHTEAGKHPVSGGFKWGWGSPEAGSSVTLDRDTRILLASNLDDSCAVWDAEHEDTSCDGDIGYAAAEYPYESAFFFEVRRGRRDWHFDASRKFAGK